MLLHEALSVVIHEGQTAVLTTAGIQYALARNDAGSCDCYRRAKTRQHGWHAWRHGDLMGPEIVVLDSRWQLLGAVALDDIPEPEQVTK